MEWSAIYLLVCLVGAGIAQNSTLVEIADEGGSEERPQPVHNPPPERPIVDSQGLIVPLWSPICAHEGLNRISSDCSHYHNCVAIDGYYRVFTYRCPDGYVFDTRQASCAPVNDVPECRTDNRNLDESGSQPTTRPETRIVWNPVPAPVGPIFEDRPETEDKEHEEKEIEPITTEEPVSDTTELPVDEEARKEKDESATGGQTGRNLTNGEHFWTRDYKCPANGLQRHPKYCNQYYSCEKSHVKNMFVLSVFHCPTPLLFDQGRQICDWPQKVPDCVSVVVTESSAPTTQSIASSEDTEITVPSTRPPSPSTRYQRPPYKPTPKPGSESSARPAIHLPVTRPNRVKTSVNKTQSDTSPPTIEVVIPPRPALTPALLYNNNNKGIKGGNSSNVLRRSGPFWSPTRVRGYALVLNRPTPKPPAKGRPTPTTTTERPPVKGKPSTTTTRRPYTRPPPPPQSTPDPYPEPQPDPYPDPNPEPNPEPHPHPHPHPPPQPERPNLVCTNEGQFMADANDCSKFYRCANGLVHEFYCPAGLLFDVYISVCNWPHAVALPCGRPRDGVQPVTRGVPTTPLNNRQTITQTKYFWIPNGQTYYTPSSGHIPQERSYQTLYYDQNGNQLIILPQIPLNSYSTLYYRLKK